MKGAVVYAGGKSNVADFLAKLFPPHVLYIDLFCGGLSVSLSKLPSRTEWFNDKYNLLINFFWVIQKCPDEFIQWFEDNWIFDSEYAYRVWFKKSREYGVIEEPNVEAAAMFWMLQHQQFGGKTSVDLGESYSITYSSHHHGKHGYDLPIKNIKALYRRLNHVYVLCRDFRDVFAQFEGRDGVFVFQDPPYWDNTGGRDYAHLFTWQDHVDLRDLNIKTSAKWLMTINNHPDIRALYEGEEGIFFREYGIVYTVNPNHNQTKVTELLISNYDTRAELGPLFSWRETEDEEVE